MTLSSRDGLPEVMPVLDSESHTVQVLLHRTIPKKAMALFISENQNSTFCKSLNNSGDLIVVMIELCSLLKLRYYNSWSCRKINFPLLCI